MQLNAISRLTLGLIASSIPLMAQAPPAGDLEAELLALLNAPVNVASAKAATLREIPGVVSVITREDIRAAGSRDITDVLRLVPGLDLAYDAQGVTGLGARGLWAYEGKALFIVNGVEMPELLYGNTPLAHRFPIENIKKIEIIRGPGSAIYGGFAELAVIKISMLDADDLKDHFGGALTYGQGSGDRLHSIANFAYAGGENLKITLGGHILSGQQGTEKYVVPGGTTSDMREQSGTRSGSFYFGLNSKHLSVTGNIEEAFYENPDTAADAIRQNTRFKTQGITGKYTFEVAENFKITPQVSWLRSNPWILEWTDTGQDYVKSRTVVRTKYGVSASWTMSKQFDLNFGAEHYNDSATVGKGSLNEDGSPTVLTTDGRSAIDFNSNAGFFELGYTGPVNITVGGRYEKHSAAGSAFVPRAAITKAIGHFHFKALYAQAFRTPNVLNLGRPSAGTTTIESEKTETKEVELGYQFGSWFLTANGFDTKLEKPLVWNSGGYRNGPEVATRGYEVELKKRAGWGFMTATYSHHGATKNGVVDWAVPGHDDRFVGMASNKATLLASYKLGENFTIDPSIVYMNERYGYDWSESAQDMIIRKFDPATLVNLQLQWHSGKWGASIGGFDLTNKSPRIIQAYNGYGPAMGGQGREIVLKIRYGL